MAAALRLHARQHGGDAVEHALDVDVDGAVPLVDLELVQRRQRHHARVVDQHVDAAEGLDGGGGELFQIGALGHVGGDGDGFAAGLADLGDDLVEPVGAAGREHHLGAARGQVARRRFAQAAAGTGDDGNLALDVVLNGGHGISLGCVEEVHAVWKIHAFQ
ncbi:hypothetical protein D9M68_680550 [compost metagenome]